MDIALYDYSPLPERPHLRWPDGARLAFYLGLNLEHYQVDRPSTSIFSGTTSLVPDPLNYGWRDYGPRVGVWRMMKLFDELGIRASALVNADVMRMHPQIVEAGLRRDWAWVAHGRNNSILEAGMTPDEELAYLTEVVNAIEAATGQRPRGWLGPALTETFETPRLLAEVGLRYVLDWTCDDQPFALNVPGHRFLSVPYSIELNDVTMFGAGMTGPDFQRAVIDQFDQLYADSAETGRVMALCLHPFLVGQPFRHKYLAAALEHVLSHEGVWLTTSDEIADWYMSEAFAEVSRGMQR